MRALTRSTLKFIIGSVEVPAAGNKPTTWYQVPYLQWTRTVVRVAPQAFCEPVGFRVSRQVDVLSSGCLGSLRQDTAPTPLFQDGSREAWKDA